MWSTLAALLTRTETAVHDSDDSALRSKHQLPQQSSVSSPRSAVSGSSQPKFWKKISCFEISNPVLFCFFVVIPRLTTPTFISRMSKGKQIKRKAIERKYERGTPKPYAKTKHQGGFREHQSKEVVH